MKQNENGLILTTTLLLSTSIQLGHVLTLLIIKDSNRISKSLIDFVFAFR